MWKRWRATQGCIHLLSMGVIYAIVLCSQPHESSRPASKVVELSAISCRIYEEKSFQESQFY
jgi:hypothetical protein